MKKMIQELKNLHSLFFEYIDFPIMLNKYDTALLKEDREELLVIIYKVPTIDSDHLNYDEKSYLAYDLIACDLVDDDKIFQLNYHPHACNLEKIDNEYLTDNQKRQYMHILEHLKEKESSEIN